IWSGIAKTAREESQPGATSLLPSYRFLWCWIAVYFLFFSLASTKLPNYILPVYAPLAILMARFLERWWAGTIHPAAWALHVSVACFALIGLVTTAAFLVAAGVIRLPLPHGVQLGGLASLAVLGVLPIGGAAAAWCCLWRGQCGGLVVSATAS